MITYTIIGRLINDSESIMNQKGKVSEKFTIAVNQSKDKSKLYTCHLNGDRSLKLHPYLTKGRQVMIIGSPSWRDYNGKEYESVSVSTLEFCGSMKDPIPQEQNPQGKPYTMDGKFFDTKEELDTYRVSKSPDGLEGPETWEDDIPF